MNHDVFLSYDESDVEVGRKICKLFEDNGIKCWFKSRDYSSADPSSRIFDAIAHAKAFVLVFTKNSKDSESVNREVNNVFSSPTKIMILNVDGTSITGKLEYYLKNQYQISLFPNHSKKLKTLVEDTSGVVLKDSGRITVDSQIKKYFRQFEPRENKNLKYAAIAGVAVIAVILIVWFLVIPSGLHTTDDGKFKMNISNVDVENLNGKYVYTVWGDAYNMPADSGRYIMQLKFFDGENNQVYELNSTCDEFKGRVLAQFNKPNDNITHVDFKLVDFTDNIICNETYKIK